MSEKDKWMEASEVLSFFPTFVWKTQLTSKFRQRVNSNILQVIKQIKPDWAELPPGASWQSGQDLHNREELVDLISCIDSTAQTVLRFLKVGHNEIDITGCWANISARGASHAIHSHPNNFLSGIYYVRTHPGADSVAPNESDKLRISISFNMMFSHYAEQLSGPLWGSTDNMPLAE